MVATSVVLHPAPRLAIPPESPPAASPRCSSSGSPRPNRLGCITRGEPLAACTRAVGASGPKSIHTGVGSPPSATRAGRRSQILRVSPLERLDLAIAASRSCSVRTFRPGLPFRGAMPHRGDPSTLSSPPRGRALHRRSRRLRCLLRFSPQSGFGGSATCHGQSHRRMHGDGIKLARDSF